jgi:ethanolaminephosphotransferase
MGAYLSESGAAALKAYKYVGSDNSLIYKHILTPMNVFLIGFFPRWLAPNAITLIGLACCLLAHGITIFYNPAWYGSGQNTIMPTWAYIAVAFLVFAYQTLDNLDGRQARRTLTSSPLGLLFDHGVDALNATLTTLTVCACLCTEAYPWITFQLWSQTVVPFFHATWEEYYVGELYLGVINGPTEGILLGCTFVALNAIMCMLIFR